MSEPQYEPITLPHPGPPDLGVSFLMPQGWNLIPLPEEPPRFDEPGYFKPLAIAMAPYGAVLFTLAVRPAFEDGSVRQWTVFLCGENKVEIDSGQETTRFGLEGCLVEGHQASDAGPLKMRLFMFEDGKRLFQVNIVAPEQIWPSVEPQLDFMQRSLRLDQTMGQTAPLVPPAPPVEEAPPAEPAALGEATSKEELERPTEPHEVALADDSLSLDPEQSINANIRNSGHGFVVKVLEVNGAEKYAVVAAAALEAKFRIPLGWHAIDDTQRTLIFDAGGKMQINLDRSRIETTSADEFFAERLAEYTAQQPEVQSLRMRLADCEAMALRNLMINQVMLEQVFLLRPVDADGKRIVCRVTADSANIEFALNAAEVVLRSLQGLRSESPEEPADWRVRVEQLFDAGQVEEAEKLLLASINHLGVYSSCAYLWEREAARRAGNKDRAGAKEAAQKASDYLYQYAGSATSGGEGAALSRERDERLVGLKSYLA